MVSIFTVYGMQDCRVSNGVVRNSKRCDGFGNESDGS